MRSDILKTIKEQDKELLPYENQMVSLSIMIIGALAGYMAKKYAVGLLERTFN